MINGVGPMSYVKNTMSYDVWRGERTIKQPDQWDSQSRVNVPGSEQTEEGILAFATAHEQVIVANWNAGQQAPTPNNDMSRMQ